MFLEEKLIILIMSFFDKNYKRLYFVLFYLYIVSLYVIF